MPFNSPFPAIEIPDVSLPDLILGRLAEQPDKPALIDGPSGRTLTYGQLEAAIRRTAVGLARAGLHKGDVFAIFSPNVPEYPVVFYAVSMLGGVVTTVNPTYTEDELAYQLKDSGARFLFTVPPFLPVARGAAARTGVEHLYVLGEGEGATPFAALQRGEGPLPAVRIHPDEDVAILPYSSGTTGLPKGVMLTHRNLVANVLQTRAVEQMTGAETLIGILPFYHIYGLTVIMSMAVHCRCTIVTMPRFDLEQFLSLIQTYRISLAHLVPPIILGLAKHPVVDEYDLSSLANILSGAAPLGEHVARACGDRIDCVVRQGYGLTEASPVTHVMTIDRPIKAASVGFPLPNTEVMIVDVASAEPLPAGEKGEIWIRGPQVMKGYLNNPEATRGMLDEEGWLHTGDVGYVDEDGYHYVVDRVKELIKYKGYQVAPAEIEGILLEHPAVADAAVVPSPDEVAGEVPKAFVVLKPGARATGEELMAFVAGRVAPFKKVRRVEFLSEIPKVASGKILRRKLVQRERARAAAE